MRPIIGVIAGNIVLVVISGAVSAVLGAILVCTLLFTSEFPRLLDDLYRIGVSEIASRAFAVAQLLTIPIGAICAGYVAAWIARRAELLCGLLSAVYWVLGSHWSILVPWQTPNAFGFGWVLLAPLLGVLGAQMRKATAKHRVPA